MAELWGPPFLDVSATPIQLGDSVEVINWAYKGDTGIVVGLHWDSGVQLVSTRNNSPTKYWKWPENLKVTLDPDLRVDEGL